MEHQDTFEKLGVSRSQLYLEIGMILYHAEFAHLDAEARFQLISTYREKRLEEEMRLNSRLH